MRTLIKRSSLLYCRFYVESRVAGCDQMHLYDGNRRIPVATDGIWDVHLLRDCRSCFNYKHSDGGTGGSCSVVLVVSPLVYLIMEAITA